MPRVKEDTFTDTKMAEFYGWTPQSFGNWNRSKNIQMLRRYEALKAYYLQETNDKEPIRKKKKPNR